jgi:hypothetical protein
MNFALTQQKYLVSCPIQVILRDFSGIAATEQDRKRYTRGFWTASL